MDQYGNPNYGHYNPHGQAPPPKRSSAMLWLLIIGGGGAIFVLGCCGICGGLAYIGFEEDEAYLTDLFEDHEIIQDKIGTITSIERDWGKSMADEDEDIWYFRIEGDKGGGDIVICDTGFGDVELEWATLTLDSGEEFDIYP